MSDFGSLMYSILSGGTWTTYGSTPTIITVNDMSDRYNHPNVITIGAGSNTPLLATNGAVIQRTYSGPINFKTPNETLRDKLMADYITILQAAGYPFTISGETSFRSRNNYEYDVTISILT